MNMKLKMKPILLSAFILLEVLACKKSDSKGASVVPDNKIPKDTVLVKITRDKYTWPFASTSIWNMPIGSNAIYLPANLPVAQHFGIDEEWHIKVAAGDPVRDIFEPTSWGNRWPGGKKLGEMQVPDQLIIPDANPPHTPNACAVFFLPDGKHIKQLEPACRVETGKQIIGYPWPKDIDLYGEGIGGTHYGSGLSALGGSIRLGELTGDKAIRHALKLNVWGKYLYYGNDVKGFRWPADRSDSYAANNYHGQNAKLVMGTLLAIRPSVKLESADLKTNAAKKIFNALKDYGAYVTDDSGWDDYDLCAAREVLPEMSAVGVNLVGNSGDFYKDMMKIIPLLHIVDNNSATEKGGGGIPRQPLAPSISN